MRTDTRTHSAPTTSSGRRWLPLGLGIAGLLAIPVMGRLLRILMQGEGIAGVSPSQIGVVLAILLAVAGLATGIAELRRHQGSWPLWTGTVFSGLVALFWGAFALGEVLFPH
jgi:hypothetical protein